MEVKKIKIGGFELKIRKLTNQPKSNVIFLRRLEVLGIDTSREIEPTLIEKLREKNEQLSIKGVRKVLVLIKKYVFAKTNNVIYALSRINEIWEYENFDEIYFEESPGNFILVFSKDLRNAWILNNFTINDSFIGLFQLWISHLRDKDPEKNFPDSQENFNGTARKTS